MRVPRLLKVARRGPGMRHPVEAHRDVSLLIELLAGLATPRA
jgi:hypothetical protein